MHWKDWCWSWNSSTLATWCEEQIHLKRPWCWEWLKAEGDNRGWHPRPDGHEFEQAPGVGDGQESLECCSPWGHKELDTTKQQLLQLYPTLCDPVDCQAPLSIGLSRQEYWSGLPCIPSGIFPTQGSNLHHWGSPLFLYAWRNQGSEILRNLSEILQWINSRHIL